MFVTITRKIVFLMSVGSILTLHNSQPHHQQQGRNGSKSYGWRSAWAMLQSYSERGLR